MRHTLVIDAGASGWQAPRTGTSVRQVCGRNSVSTWRVPTDGDHVYASGSEPGLSTLGAMSPSRGGCYTCAACDIRLVGRKWRSKFARHTMTLACS
jgi:hypothetical protein